MHLFRTLGVVAGLAAALTVVPSIAFAGPLVDLTVVDETVQRNLPLYTQRGERFIAGQPGHRYALRLTNRTGARVLTVVSVDGVNVVTGETAHPQQTGYVLPPYGSVDIEGWRKSDADVAEFLFTSLTESYAAQTGRPGDVGAIGVAVFEEYVPPPPPPVYRPKIADAQRENRQASAPAPSAAPAEPSAKSRGDAGAAADSSFERQESLGTGHGDRRWSPVSRTHFERASRYPSEITVVRYDSAENLRARGIRVPYERPNWRHEPRPNPFPEYVPDPPRRW